MINEETLTLYYYDDGLTDAERQKVEAALRDDAKLAARYEALCHDFEQMRVSETPPAPSHLVQRWHDSIDRAARVEIRKAHSTPKRFFSFAWGAGLTAALVLGVGIGTFFSGDAVMPPTDTIPIASVQASAVPAAFTRGLQVHLQDSQWEITKLPIGAATDNTDLLLQIIDQNRMFERAAKQNNSPKIARVLRAFEPILMRLASDDIAPEDAEALRAQLAFELNVMLTKLARDTSEEQHST